MILYRFPAREFPVALAVSRVGSLAPEPLLSVVFFNVSTTEEPFEPGGEVALFLKLLD